MRFNEVNQFIVNWLKEYSHSASMNGFVVGISGGIDSAVTSMLCAQTGLDVLLVNMPIRQTSAEYARAKEHISDLSSRFKNVNSIEINLSDLFRNFEGLMPDYSANHHLAMANSRARLRMTTLYALGQAKQLLVAGTGNKVEDFGIGFFTKYGDGGVDVSPIADLMKTEVYKLAKHLKVVDSILIAKPTDGLWEDDRNDEDQIGASYPELEWAMMFKGDESILDERQIKVLKIYRRFNSVNQHKMVPIPCCLIPDYLK